MDFIQLLVANKATIEVLASLITLLGVPTGIGVYILQKREERIDQENSYYESLNERYVKYLELCLNNENEDTFDVEKGNPEMIKSGLSIKQLILYSILVSMLEAAYIKYPQLHKKVQKSQGEGWFKYMEGWASDEKFRKAWRIIGNQFESGFVSHMDRLIRK